MYDIAKRGYPVRSSRHFNLMYLFLLSSTIVLNSFISYSTCTVCEVSMYTVFHNFRQAFWTLLGEPTLRSLTTLLVSESVYLHEGPFTVFDRGTPADDEPVLPCYYVHLLSSRIQPFEIIFLLKNLVNPTASLIQ